MGSSYSALATTDDNDVIISRENSNVPVSIVPSSNRPIVRPAVHLDAINSLAVVRSGMVISCSSDKTIVLNNMDTGACIMRWRGHEKEVTKAIYKHVGCKHFVLSASKDCTIKLWYFHSPDPCRQFNAHRMAVNALAALDDSKFVSGSRDGCLNIWDMNVECRPLMSVCHNRNLITHIEYEPHTQMLCQTSEDGCLRLWDKRSLALICEFPSKTHALLHCDVCSSSMTCLTSSAGSYDYGSEVSNTAAPNLKCNQIKFSKKYNDVFRCVQLSVESTDLWDLRERKLLKEFNGHEANVRCSIFLHQQAQFTWKRFLLSVSNDQTARVWNINTGACVWTETIPAELNTCVAFPDGSVVIGGGNATLCDMRLMDRVGRPYLQCNSIQSNSLEQNF